MTRPTMKRIETGPSLEQQYAQFLYDSLIGDLHADDVDHVFALLAAGGYTDENGEWIYDDD